MAQEPWRQAPDGIILDVRLTPRGGRDAIEGIESRADGRIVLRARVRAAPTDGEANTALCRLIGATLGIAPGRVTIAGGATARVKRLRIAGDAAVLIAALRRMGQRMAVDEWDASRHPKGDGRGLHPGYDKSMSR
jgi:uncharacterized protein